MSDKHNNDNNIDQIRELIFGSQIHEFEERFKQIELRMGNLIGNLRNEMVKSHEGLKKKTKRSLTVLEEKIDNLAAATQNEQHHIKKMIHNVDQELRDKVAMQKDEFKTRLKMTRESIADEQEQIRESIRTTRNELHDILENRLNALADEKLARDQMAQMLLEVAMKIRGTNVTALLTNKTEDEETEPKH